MQRRRELMAIRVGRERKHRTSPWLSKASAGHLNPQLWDGRREPVGPTAKPSADFR
jgi:hypothetical protein